MDWHVITSEYPPQVGGVADYTREVATGLARQGDTVHVWCAGLKAPTPTESVSVQQVLGTVGLRDLWRLGSHLDRFPSPRRILVQWVPHGYGWRSMNIGFCCWLWKRARYNRDRIEIMVHEPYLSMRGGSWRQKGAAIVHRLMTVLLLRAAQHVWVSIPDWEVRWRAYTLGKRVPFQWLPIPSNIPVVKDKSRSEKLRSRYAGPSGFLIGHFGTFGSPITTLLDSILPALLTPSENRVVLLMGLGSMEYRNKLVSAHPHLKQVVHATGAMDEGDLSVHLAACELLIQPYVDGVSTRRTSVMAGLSHGKPIVSTTGHSSETFWRESGALALAPVGKTGTFVELVCNLQTDGPERERMGRAARTLYQSQFDITHVISALRGSARSQAAQVA